MKFKKAAITSIKFPPQTKIKEHHLVQHILRKIYTLPIGDDKDSTNTLEFNIVHDTILDKTFTKKSKSTLSSVVNAAAVVDDKFVLPSTTLSLSQQPLPPFSIVIECKENCVRQGYRFTNGKLIYVDVMDMFRYQFPKDVFEKNIERMRLQSMPNKIESLYYWTLKKGFDVFHITMTDNYDDNPVILTIYYEIARNFKNDADICALLNQIIEFHKDEYMSEKIIFPQTVNSIRAKISYFHDIQWTHIEKCEFDDLFLVIRDAFQARTKYCK